jgi:hypothetical protein
VGAGVLAIAMIVVSSLDPAQYFSGYDPRHPMRWEHPTKAVAITVAAAFLETAIGFTVFGLRGPGRMWARALVGLVALLPWGWHVGRFVIHAPGFWIVHVLWVWLVVLSLVLAATVSGARHVYSLAHTRSG